MSQKNDEINIGGQIFDALLKEYYMILEDLVETLRTQEIVEKRNLKAMIYILYIIFSKFRIYDRLDIQRLFKLKSL